MFSLKIWSQTITGRMYEILELMSYFVGVPLTTIKTRNMRTYLILLILFVSKFMFSQTEFQQIDTLLTQISEKSEFNGIVLIGNNDSILFSKSYGFADFKTKTKIDLNTQFDSLDTWDSLGKLSLIALIDESFNVQISDKEFNSFQTIQDLYAALKSKN